jgi:hypothetical protein
MADLTDLVTPPLIVVLGQLHPHFPHAVVRQHGLFDLQSVQLQSWKL